MFAYSRKVWADITQNEAGHTVATDLFKALSFGAGIAYLFLLVPLVLLLTQVVLPLEVAVILLGNGLSLNVIKEVKSYNLRRTADGGGNALATPESVQPPADVVALMPQVETPPTAPTAPDK